MVKLISQPSSDALHHWMNIEEEEEEEEEKEEEGKEEGEAEEEDRGGT